MMMRSVTFFLHASFEKKTKIFISDQNYAAKTVFRIRISRIKTRIRQLIKVVPLKMEVVHSLINLVGKVYKNTQISLVYVALLSLIVLKYPVLDFNERRE